MDTQTEADRVPRVDVLGVGISCTDIPGVVESIAAWIAGRDAHYICVTGMHGVMEAQEDIALREIHNRSGLTTPDGMPMVWASRWAGVKNARRVYGPDLMAAALRHGIALGWRSYLYGGAPGVAEQFAERIRSEDPGVQIVGCCSPPFRELDA